MESGFNGVGKTISTKRDELTAMCDHMMLQPDNPMLILNQESARQFLTSSTPGGRYTVSLKTRTMAL